MENSVEHLQLDARLFALLLDNLHVLDEVLDKEARRKVPGQRARRHILQLPAARGARTDGRQHLLRVQAGVFGVDQRLGVGCGRARHRNLVGRLGVLPAACRAHQDDVFAHALEEREGFFKVLFVAADHDREGGVARAAVPAGDRRVHHADALGLALLIQPLRQRRRGGGHIDGQRPGFGGLEDAALPAEHLLDVAWVADHHKDVVRVLHRLGGAVAGMDAKFLLQLQQLFVLVGVGADIIAVFGQMARLLAAHHARSNPRNLFVFHHWFLLYLFVVSPVPSPFIAGKGAGGFIFWPAAPAA